LTVNRNIGPREGTRESNSGGHDVADHIHRIAHP
jgi:hypothetical protein